jgi:hypothetical protein
MIGGYGNLRHVDIQWPAPGQLGLAVIPQHLAFDRSNTNLIGGGFQNVQESLLLSF